MRAAVLASLALGGTLIFGRNLDAPADTGFEAIDTGGLTEYRSRNHVLRATLTAEPQSVTVGAVQFAGAAYNGRYGGPVLRVHAGDRVQLHLINQMADAINLHFHGLRISPNGHADNMHILVRPGDSFDYDFTIPPNHPPGLFWYHDHAFGAADAHVTAGLSGALLIDGFAAQFVGLGGVTQKLLVLKDWQQEGCDDATLKTQWHCRIVSINGDAAWADTMAPNGQQIWRISNQGANLTLHLAAPGLVFRIIGRDGLPSREALHINTLGVNTLDIVPAARLDVLVRANNAGIFTLSAIGVPTGHGTNFSISRTLGSIAVRGPATPVPPPVNLLQAEADLRGGPIGAHRLVVFGQNDAASIYTINGRVFDPARIDWRIPLGTVEEWGIRNDTADFHAFHIHQLSFQVTAINGVAQNFAGDVDTVPVPAHSSVTLLVPFTDPVITGHIMFHCHVLKHEDRGMMASIDVYAQGARRICHSPALAAHP